MVNLEPSTRRSQCGATSVLSARCELSRAGVIIKLDHTGRVARQVILEAERGIYGVEEFGELAALAFDHMPAQKRYKDIEVKENRLWLPELHIRNALPTYIGFKPQEFSDLQDAQLAGISEASSLWAQDDSVARIRNGELLFL